MKKIYLILLVFALFGCRASKSSNKETTSTIVRKDSIIYKEKIVIRAGIADTLRIEAPCDSITGNISPVNTHIKTPGGSVSLTSSGNALVLTTDIKNSLDTTTSSSNVSIKDSTTTSSESVRVKTYVWTKWTYIFLIIALIELIIILVLIRSKVSSILTFFKNLFI